MKVAPAAYTTKYDSKNISFHGFSRLPIELRPKIWSFASITYPSQTFILSTRSYRKPRNKHIVTTISATGPQPVLAHINQEARSIALTRLSRIPTTIVSNDRSAKDYPPDYKCALVDFSNDFFALTSVGAIPTHVMEIAKEFQLLKVLARDIVRWFPDEFKNSCLHEITALREIEFTIPEGHVRDEDEEEEMATMVQAFDDARRQRPDWVFPKVKIIEDGIVLKEYAGGIWTGERQIMN